MKIEKIKIFSSKIEKQYQFYCHQLMLDCAEKNENYFCIQAGSSILQIEKSTELIDSCYHIAFNINPSLFLEAVSYLQQKNISLLENENNILIDFPDWNARSIYFKDADGNILEFIARFNLPHHPQVSVFDSRDILSISEIGVPVKDTDGFLSAILSKTTIEVWKSYGKSFIAAGDEEGLLIIVPEKHKWFPTNIAAEQFPVEISIKQKGHNFSFGNVKFHFMA